VWRFNYNATAICRAKYHHIYFQEEPLVEHSLLNRLGERIENKSLLDHPYYQAWKAGELTLEDLQVYVVQYYFFEANFPRYLSCLSSCGD
jgi:pyrroloquinoline quinone (PQQ) biosynthesis protein C